MSFTCQWVTRFISLIMFGELFGGWPYHLVRHPTLLAIRKKNGRMCTIPVGEVLRRLTSKSLSCAIHSVWPLPFFFPYNFESEFDMDVKPLSMQPLASWKILPSPQMIDGLFSWIFPMPLIASTGSPCSSNSVLIFPACLSAWVEFCYGS